MNIKKSWSVPIIVIVILFGVLGSNGWQNDKTSDDVTSMKTTAKTLNAEITAEETSATVGTETTYITETFTSQTTEESYFEVHFIDVGQADSSLIICDGEAMLIDGGNSEESSLIYSYLRDHEVTHLKYIVNTHPDEDHVGGLSGALNYADAEIAYSSVTEYDSKAFNSFVKYLNDTELTVPQVGTELELGSATGIVLGPISVYDNMNENSLVIKMTYGDTSFLFTGDAGEEAEYEMIRSGYNLSADVLKVGHHGSSSSSTVSFLKAVSPSAAVISCGAGNSYGHPTDQTLDRLASFGVTLYRTDLQGHIVCTSDGESVSFTTQKNQDAETYVYYSELNLTEATMAYAEVDTDSGSDDVHTYILNTNSKKIHTVNCNSVTQMKEKNKKEVNGTLDEIMVQYSGYTVCGNCHAQY